VETDGTIACWGDNTYGQATPPVGSFSQVSAGESHTCGVRTDGTIACWGDNTAGNGTPAMPPGGSFSQVSAGWSHTCGVRTDGTIACWGLNGYGEAIPPAGTFSQVSAANWYSCAIDLQQRQRCWGWLALPPLEAPPAPEPVPVPHTVVPLLAAALALSGTLRARLGHMLTNRTAKEQQHILRNPASRLRA
jgi:hypothetical protein